MAQQKTDSYQGSGNRDLFIKDADIWDGNGFSKGSILIRDGKIKRLARIVNAQDTETIKADGLYALPGMVDVHVHLRDLGLSYKEDFGTGTAAAAAGGFTTVLDMPNTVPPTDSPSRLTYKKREAGKKAFVNVGFHAAATTNPQTVEGLAKEGAFSLKLYMPKPISPLNVNDDSEIRRLMRVARHVRLPITVHAEDMADAVEPKAGDSFGQLAKDRGPILETEAVERILRLQRSTGAKVHFCHLTLASSLKRIRTRSSKSTSEVTPHHLLLSTRALRRVGWRAWMVPPLRTNSTCMALRDATAASFCDVVASDHAPHTVMEKRRDPRDSVPGIPGLETTLPLMLTLVSKGKLTFRLLIKMLAENPAKIFNLGTKAKLQEGYDGDLVLIDPKKKSRIDSSRFFSKAKFSPFDGFQTIGSVNSTIVDGRLVYHDGELVSEEGTGSVLRNRISS